MTFIVATNVVASRPPERQPTGTPHARANQGQTSQIEQNEIKQGGQPNKGWSFHGRHGKRSGHGDTVCGDK